MRFKFIFCSKRMKTIEAINADNLFLSTHLFINGLIFETLSGFDLISP